MRKEKVGVKMHWFTQLIHLVLNPWSRRTFSKKDHFIVSKAFSVSIFRAIRPPMPLFFFIVLRTSWAIMELSWITLPGTKADCHEEMILWGRGLNRVAKIFEMIVYVVLQRLIGQNWLTFAALSDFGSMLLIYTNCWGIYKLLRVVFLHGQQEKGYTYDPIYQAQFNGSSRL